MGNIIKSCHICKKEIEIDTNNITGVAKLDQFYYHTHCLKEYAQVRVSKPKHIEKWDYVLAHLDLCEKDAKNTIITKTSRDKLNTHLLNHYNIYKIPEAFWRKISNLNNGTVNQKECKSVTPDIFADAWIWSQRNLDIINRNNKVNKRGPKNDSERLNYDFSIVLSHIPDYLNYLKKQELEEAERTRQEKERIKIDYTNIVSNTEVKTSSFDDISDFLNDIF